MRDAQSACDLAQAQRLDALSLDDPQSFLDTGLFDIGGSGLVSGHRRYARFRGGGRQGGHCDAAAAASRLSSTTNANARVTRSTAASLLYRKPTG